MSDPISIAALAWKARFPIALAVGALAVGGLVMRNGTLAARVETAQAAAAESARVARVNEETINGLRRLQEETLAAIARDAQAARERAERTAETLEGLRREPTYSTTAAPVLRRAVEQLRARRGDGGADAPRAASGLPPGAAGPSAPP